MNVQESYNQWAAQYDTNLNKTRDLEAVELRNTLGQIHFDDCLEIGCGTGKNTVWFADHAKQVTSVDLSAEMLAVAKQKVTKTNVEFVQTDITAEWSFIKKQYDLVSFSLVLEHIENLNYIFKNVADALKPGGYMYIGELHPFKQYGGSKARFETAEGMHIVECYNHHISEFLNIAHEQGLELASLNEAFDDNDRTTVPRLLILLFRKK